MQWGWHPPRALYCAVLALALVSGCGTSGKPDQPTPHVVTHKVDLSGSVFAPEPVPSGGILSAEQAFKIYSGHTHWPEGMIVQYGKLTHPPQRPGAPRVNLPVDVWAFEAIGLCQVHGLSGATPAQKYCRTWDFLSAKTGEGVLSIGL